MILLLVFSVTRLVGPPSPLPVFTGDIVDTELGVDIDEGASETVDTDGGVDLTGG